MKTFFYEMQLYENQKERESMQFIRLTAKKSLNDTKNFLKV